MSIFMQMFFLHNILPIHTFKHSPFPDVILSSSSTTRKSEQFDYKYFQHNNRYDDKRKQPLEAYKYRGKRAITERQTGERFKSVRRNCRVLRTCNGKKRFDEDVSVLDYIDGNIFFLFNYFGNQPFFTYNNKRKYLTLMYFFSICPDFRQPQIE